LDRVDAHGERRLRIAPPLEQRAVDARLGVPRGGHAVILGRAGIALERPAEDGGVELLGSIRVVDRDLEVAGSRWHSILLGSKVRMGTLHRPGEPGVPWRDRLVTGAAPAAVRSQPSVALTRGAPSDAATFDQPVVLIGFAVNADRTEREP